MDRVDKRFKKLGYHVMYNGDYEAVYSKPILSGDGKDTGYSHCITISVDEIGIRHRGFRVGAMLLGASCDWGRRCSIPLSDKELVLVRKKGRRMLRRSRLDFIKHSFMSVFRHDKSLDRIEVKIDENESES